MMRNICHGSKCSELNVKAPVFVHLLDEWIYTDFSEVKTDILQKNQHRRYLSCQARARELLEVNFISCMAPAFLELPASNCIRIGQLLCRELIRATVAMT
ncbi:hypothetical protein PHYPO_G00145860 [Pangasianodon hypophthalmus]|uniref:Uncharacterized protein n=1 Tax=Pangasianodon hypophthalmus TaxID=310915 RepID=A0A5N5K386_PANHP|nr:hypothetical protein PHYPO_G00145860 [Pangasianodon hypophthalmus]